MRRRKRGRALGRRYGRALYRPMRPASDGRPECGCASNRLGVRPRDIRVREDGTVRPEREGMSVNADPMKLPPSLRPRSLGGSGKLPLYEIEPAALGIDLSLAPSEPHAHAIVQPARVMHIAEYQSALCRTRPAWSKT
jgi:hypothetical protein